MKLSLSGRLVEKSRNETVMPVADFIRLAARHGYQAVDLRFSQLQPDTPTEIWDEVRTTLLAEKVQVFAGQYHGSLDDSTEEEKFVQFAANHVDLGTYSLRMGASPAVLKRAARLVGPLGLRVHYQMHTNGPFETIAGAAKVWQEIDDPNFGLVPEPANLALAGLPFSRDMLAPLAKCIFGVHVQTLVVCSDGANKLKLSDGREVCYTRVPYAQNQHIPFAVFFDALRKVGFDGFVNELEPRPADGELEEVITEAAASTTRSILTSIKIN